MKRPLLGGMHWSPRSLLSRSVLLISALLVLSQLIWLGLYRTYSIRTQSEYLASQLAGVISTLGVALESMPDSARREFSEKLPSQQKIRLLPATAWDVEKVVLPDSPLLRSLSEHLKRDFASDVHALVTLEDTNRALWIKIRIKSQAYWVVFPADARGSPSAWAWAGWSIFGLTLAITGGYVLMLRVNRPLRALAAAAAEIGAGKTPSPLDENGPSEIRALSHAFNQMTADLKRMDTDRSVLLAGISHDLRTPLSRLRLGVEMLGEAQDDGLKPGMIEDIEDMDAIINQFLDFAREGTSEASRPGEDLNHIVSSVCDRFARTGQSIRTHLGALPPLTLKPMATQRMVTNLVDNAVRYAGGEIDVMTERTGDCAIVRVLDRGPGIPAADLPRVMQAFTRLEASRAGGKGSGLGLAIVERAARMQGGSVKLIGREGGGLEARVELPLQVAKAA